jgi:hypothetical protein
MKNNLEKQLDITETNLPKLQEAEHYDNLAWEGNLFYGYTYKGQKEEGEKDLFFTTLNIDTDVLLDDSYLDKLMEGRIEKLGLNVDIDASDGSIYRFYFSRDSLEEVCAVADKLKQEFKDIKLLSSDEDLISMIKEMSSGEIEEIAKSHKTDPNVLVIIAGINSDYNDRYCRALWIVANPNATENLVKDLVLENIGMGIPDNKAKPFIAEALKNDKISSDVIDLIVGRCVRPVGTASSYNNEEMYTITTLSQTSGEALKAIEKMSDKEMDLLENISEHPNVLKETLENIFEKAPTLTDKIMRNSNFEKIKSDFTTSPKNILKLANKDDRLKFFAGKKIEVKATENTIILHKGKKIASAIIELTQEGIKATYNINKPKMQVKVEPGVKQKKTSKKKQKKLS